MENKEKIYVERYKPHLDRINGRWLEQHKYYAHIPAFYKEVDDRKWRKGRGFILAKERINSGDFNTLPYFSGEYEKELDQIAVMKNEENLSADYEKDCDNSSPIFRKEIAFIPFINAEYLVIREQLLVTCETLILHGNIGRIYFEPSNEPETDILKNLWVYGDLKSVCILNAHSIKKLRLPHTLKHIEANNTVDILGLGRIVEHNEDLKVDMLQNMTAH